MRGDQAQIELNCQTTEKITVDRRRLFILIFNSFYVNFIGFVRFWDGKNPKGECLNPIFNVNNN